MTDVLKTVSPVDLEVLVERPLFGAEEVAERASAGQEASRTFRRLPLAERGALLTKLLEEVRAEEPQLAEEITLQMGRPIAQAPGELDGFQERGEAMIRLGREALETIDLPPRPGTRRYIERVPLGVVLVLAPWNYPWLTAVNAVVPALMAGNAVLLKHSDQTPWVSERFVRAAERAGLPKGLFDFLHMSHETTATVLKEGLVDHVAFTGSVQGGRAVERSAAIGSTGAGLELGGKDAAYVAEDAALDGAVGGLVDGAFFNSGQSCCGIERIYVHRSRYDDFVEAFLAATLELRLGDPTDPATTLGPVVRPSNAATIRAQVEAAVAKGAKALVDEARFDATSLGPHYLAPQVLVDVDHSMDVMCEETFGPVVGIVAVESDEDAIEKINDSRYGLTASIWTTDLERAERVGRAAEVGTVFMNRCDYLDPELAWVGVKDSGRGVSLSRLGYETLTRPRSFHLVTDPES